MSGISTYERFFLGRIAIGLENIGDNITQDDIETLLSENTSYDADFSTKIKNALVNSYTADLNSFSKKIVTSNPSQIWSESVTRLYKGRETVLRDIVINWYKDYSEPSFWNRLKGIFRR